MLCELFFEFDTTPHLPDIKTKLRATPAFEGKLRNQLLLSLQKILTKKSNEELNEIANLLIADYFSNWKYNHHSKFIDSKSHPASPIDDVTKFLKHEAYLVIKNYRQELEWKVFTDKCLPLFYAGAIAVAFFSIAMLLSALTVGVFLYSLLINLAAVALPIAVVFFTCAAIFSIDLGLTRLYHVCVETFSNNKEASVPIEACVIFPPAPPVLDETDKLLFNHPDYEVQIKQDFSRRPYTLFDNIENLTKRLLTFERRPTI